MKLKTAKLLVRLCPGLSLNPGYSGRSMYGETTVAVSGGSEDARDAVADAIYECGEAGDAATLQDFKAIRWDSLGRDVVAY